MPKIVLIGGRRFDYFFKQRQRGNNVTFISLADCFSWPIEVDSADIVIVSGSPFLSRKFGVYINQKAFEIQLTKVLLKLKPRTVVFISSAAVYGLDKIESIPFCEERPLNPASEYAEEKCSLEQFFNKHSTENEVSILTLRPAGFFSCFQVNGVNSFLDRVLNQGFNKDCIFSVQNGARQVRDFCEFDFLCDVILSLYDKKNTGVTCLNVKNTGGFRLDRICELFCDPTQLSFEIDDGSESIHSELDITRLRGVCGEQWFQSRYFNAIEQLKFLQSQI